MNRSRYNILNITFFDIINHNILHNNILKKQKIKFGSIQNSIQNVELQI
jgi:hypothetical protein